jgi:transglycosylase-like protein with SLT domain
MSHTSKIVRLVWLCTVLLFCGSIVHVGARKKAKRTAKKPPAVSAPADNELPESANNQISLKLTDGRLIPVDEAWESPQGIWYRQSGVTHLVPRDHVKTIERGSSIKAKAESQVSKVTEVTPTQTDPSERPAWIYLVGGARVEADSTTESTAGVWFTHGTLSVFLERSRIDHIEREDDKAAASQSSAGKERGWSTGNRKIDSLIKLNGARYGVDPYLIFCVMEQESHFNSHALSPKGASGLMQLMPGTGARFGVRHPNDPAQNVAGGTRFLKQLIERFNGRVDLVLASYNAGEGAVIKFGHRVPPYKETRAYVKRISYRYRGLKGVSPTPGGATGAGKT